MCLKGELNPDKNVGLNKYEVAYASFNGTKILDLE